VVAAAAAAGDLSAPALAVVLIVTGLVFWASHVYARLSGERRLGEGRGNGWSAGEIGQVARHEWALVEAAFLPAVAVLLGAAVGLGPVGFAWGWEVKSERLDTFGMGEDQQVIHTCVLRAWFRQPDGSKEHVEHVGHTKAAYWTRARRPGEKPRYIVDEEFGKKSVTDALSKIMVSLGASADIWLGRFDGNKYVAPSEAEAQANGAALDEKLLARAREILDEIRKASTKDEVLEAARNVKGTFNEQPFWPQLVSTDRDLAAEIQQLVRGKAKAHELDLSKV